MYPKLNNCKAQGKQAVVPKITCIVATCNIVDTEKTTMQYCCQENIGL